VTRTPGLITPNSATGKAFEAIVKASPSCPTDLIGHRMPATNSAVTIKSKVTSPEGPEQTMW